MLENLMFEFGGLFILKVMWYEKWNLMFRRWIVVFVKMFGRGYLGVKIDFNNYLCELWVIFWGEWFF